MATFSVNDGGTWKTPTNIHVNDGGTWKQVQAAWIKTGGVWEQFWTASSGSGLFVGGTFLSSGELISQPGGFAISNNMNATNLESWNPGLEGSASVFSIALSGDDVYMGGIFTTIQGTTRNYLAAVSSNVDLSPATLKDWNPNANNAVYCVYLHGIFAYVGGDFTTINGVSRTRAAVVESDTSVASPVIRDWNPKPNGTLNRMVITDSYVYLNGDFEFIEFTSRNFLACVSNDVDNSSPTLQNWDPNPNAYVNDMLLHEPDMFVCGQFSSISGVNRLRIAAIDSDPTMSTPTARTFNPGANATPYCMVISGSNMFVGGPFTSFSTVAVKGLVAFDITDTSISKPTLKSWQPDINPDGYLPLGGASIRAMRLISDSLLVSGEFRYINDYPRDNLAAISISNLDSSTITLKDLDLTVHSYSSHVNIAVTDDNIYFGGGTTLSVSGHSVDRITNYVNDPSQNSFNSDFKPYVNNTIRTIVINENSCYIGGDFTFVNGSTRNRLAALNATNEALLDWNPNVGGTVHSIILNDSDMYICGAFTTINGSTRNRLAAIESDTSVSSPTVRDWDPNSNGTVYTMQLSGADLYVGGQFTTISGMTRNRLAAVESDTSVSSPALRDWNPNAGSFVNTILLNGPDLYIGGIFTTINSISRNRLAAIESDTSVSSPAVRDWNPNSNGNVDTMQLSGADLYVGGQFTTINSISRNRLAAIESDTSVSSPAVRDWNPNADNSVFALYISGDYIYVGGSFDTINGYSRQGFASLEKDTTQASPVVTALIAANGDVRAITVA